jgi:putative nucleotidyltransferase with HDIG domain
MIFSEAEMILKDLVKEQSLLKHCYSVSAVMRSYAAKLGEDQEEWAVAGLLHDADYEKYPEKHPNVIVELLEKRGEGKIAHAISAHYTKWRKDYTNELDKYLLAVDELTGFIIAASLMRPTGLDDMKPKSVRKKLKTKGFAAGVDRDEIYKSLEIAGLDLDEHIGFIIRSLQDSKDDIGL